MESRRWRCPNSTGRVTCPKGCTRGLWPKFWTGSGQGLRRAIFGSYITAKAEPNDVDVILVMKDDFSMAACDEHTRVLFDHQRAEGEVGASIFWLCPSVVLRGSLEDFLLGWGTKRDLSCRGIVEVTS